MENISNEIKIGNEKIAEFLGWEQESTPSFLYFIKTAIGKHMIYDLRSTTYRDLPFYRDWNYLMMAVKKLEDMGFCIHSANYSRDKDVKNNLAAHIGVNLLEDFYCDISGSVIEDGRKRYFQIQRMDLERMESIFNTIVTFIDYYNDKTVKIINISNGEIDRIERDYE